MNFVRLQINRLFTLLAFRPGTIIAFFGVTLSIVIAYAPKVMAAHWGMLSVLLPFCAYDLVRSREAFLPKLQPLWPIILFMVWMGISALHGDEANALHAWATFLSIMLMIIFGITAVHVIATLSDADRDRAQVGFLWGIALATLLIAIELFAGHPFYVKYHALQSVKDVPNYVLNRGYVTICILVWPAAALFWQRGWQIVSVVLVAACIAFAIASTMEAAKLAIGFSCFMWLTGLLYRPAARMLCLAGFGLLVFGAFPIATQLYKTGFTNMTELKTSARHRIEIWHFASERIAEKPLFGWGLDASRVASNEDETSQFLAKGKAIIPLHPHNIIMQILLEMGEIGLSLFFMVGIWLLRWISRQSSQAQVFMMPAFVAILTFASLSHGIWQMWFFASIVSCIGWFALSQTRNKQNHDLY